MREALVPKVESDPILDTQRARGLLGLLNSLNGSDNGLAQFSFSTLEPGKIRFLIFI